MGIRSQREAEEKVRIAFLGRILVLAATLEEQGWVRGSVVNAFVLRG